MGDVMAITGVLIALSAAAVSSASRFSQGSGLAVTPLTSRGDRAPPVADVWTRERWAVPLIGGRQQADGSHTLRTAVGGRLPVDDGVSQPRRGPLGISSRQWRILEASRDRGFGSEGLPHHALVAGFAGRAQPALRGVSVLRDLLSTEYAGTIGVGSPATQLSVIFDTGSSDLWLASNLCKSRSCQMSGRHLFNQSQSSTFHEPLHSSAELQTVYGSGTIKGRMGVDHVHLGQLVSKDQELGLIIEEEGFIFEMLPFDGIVGLAFPGLASIKGVSLARNLAKQGALQDGRFAFYLHRDAARGGGVLWGGVDERLYSGALQSFPVVERLWWGLDLVAFKVGNQSFDFAGGRGKMRRRGESLRASRSLRRGYQLPPVLVVDSGTTFYTAEGELFRAISSQVSAMPCEQVSVLPSLEYTLRDNEGTLRTLNITPEQYMVRDEGGQPAGHCFPGVVSVGEVRDHPMMMLGEVFMRHYFTVFDHGADDSGEGATVSFAPARYDEDSEAFFLEVAASTD